ncbi:MAG: hypothetical protein IJO76_02930 [Clostridia bacterium]|nr:hypothetical protein [Clostridia bacterium]
MTLTKRLLAFLLSACLLCSLCGLSVAAQSLVANRSIVPTIGTTALTLTDENVISVMQFTPGEAGIFRFTLTGDAQLYTVDGSLFYMFNAQAAAGNTFDKEIKESYANSPMLIGVAGNGTATLTIQLVGDAAFDINALPFEIYETTATLSKFDLPSDVTLTYVDVTAPHSAVKGTDGYYHLDSAKGPKLYMDFANAPYLSVAAAAANGAMKDVIYDENGNFVKKIEFITCINEYYGYTDNTTGLFVNGYTDAGIYPLTDDLVYIMQTHTTCTGWNDPDSPNYLFVDETVDADTAWMFPLCYDENDIPVPTLQLGNAAGEPGSTVTVTFALSDTEPLKAVALSNISYDADSLELVGGAWAELDGILSDWDADKKNAVIAFTENTDVNGEIFSLTFRIKDTATRGSVLPVSCDIVAKAATDAGEVVVPVAVNGGTIQILEQGDLDNDGVITSADAVYLLYHTMLPNQYPMAQNADYNGDGVVDSGDAVYLLYHSLLPDLYPLA